MRYDPIRTRSAASQPGRDDRRVLRCAVAMKASARSSARFVDQVAITDLSCMGFRMVSDTRFELGQPMLVKMPGVEPLGFRIRWNAEGAYGCEFDAPLHNAVCDHLIALFPRDASSR